MGASHSGHAPRPGAPRPGAPREGDSGPGASESSLSALNCLTMSSDRGDSTSSFIRMLLSSFTSLLLTSLAMLLLF